MLYTPLRVDLSTTNYKYMRNLTMGKPTLRD